MTARSFHRRTSLFPTYEPPRGEGPSFEHFAGYAETLAKRVLAFATVIAVIGGGAGFLGVQVLSPKQTATRVRNLEDSVTVHSQRLADMRALLQTNIYLTCEVLDRTQPPRSIPPQECKR